MRIDLHLPQSWNHCTTEELELIAAAILREQQRTGRFHPFQWEAVKLNILLAINGIEVVSERSDADGVLSGSAAEYIVRRPQDRDPWPITTDQLYSIIDQHLQWLTDEKAAPLFQFPYPELKLEVRSKKEDDGGSPFLISHSSFLIFHGPAPLLDGYTWNDYRLLQDWMNEYMRRQNAGRDATEPQQEFLKILFKPQASSVGSDSIAPTASHLSPLTSYFSPVRWQVILFWWSALMRQLQQQFPRCFKSQNPGKGKRRKKQSAASPWTFYNQTTATMQKYLGGLSETDVNTMTYSVVLQHMENIAREAEEMERLKQKHG